MAPIASEFVTAASALAPVLNLFDCLAGQVLLGVWLRREDGVLIEVMLDFGDQLLAAIAEEDYDTLKIELRARYVLEGLTDAKDARPWRGHIGQRFGWGWLTMNKQGYVDGALLGFGNDIHPRILLNVVASEIKIGTIRF